MPNEDRRRDVLRLALEYRAEIWAFLMALAKDPNRAEDLFQNTHLIICEKWEQYRPGTNFLAWARAIARFEFLASVDPARKPYVTVEAEVIESAMEAAQERPDALADKREALRECMNKLNEKSRQALALRYEQGFPCAEVARQLRLSSNALYVMLSRVRQALLECVESRLRPEAG